MDNDFTTILWVDQFVALHQVVFIEGLVYISVSMEVFIEAFLKTLNSASSTFLILGPTLSVLHKLKQKGKKIAVT